LAGDFAAYRGSGSKSESLGRSSRLFCVWRKTGGNPKRMSAPDARQTLREATSHRRAHVLGDDTEDAPRPIQIVVEASGAAISARGTITNPRGDGPKLSVPLWKPIPFIEVHLMSVTLRTRAGCAVGWTIRGATLNDGTTDVHLHPPRLEEEL